MKKQLFFYLYSTKDTLYCETNKIHFKCLEYFKNTFDEATIGIAVDDLTDKTLIKDTEKIFFDIFSDTVERLNFIIMKNDPQLCEAAFFYNEIALKLNDLDLVFFGHGKGITNLNREDINVEGLKHWIVGMYYASLFTLDENINNITIKSFLFSGPFLHVSEDFMGYEGSFYWLNGKRIHTYCTTINKELPKLCGRFYAERFPESIIKRNLDNILMASSNNYYINDYLNFYTHGVDACNMLGYINDNFKKIYQYAIS